MDINQKSLLNIRKSFTTDELTVALNQSATIFALIQLRDDAMRFARTMRKAVFQPTSIGATRRASVRQAPGTEDLPLLALGLSRGEAGKAIRRHLRSRYAGLRLRDGLSVLTLPEEPGDYLRGRKKQALRTNLTQADRLRISSRRTSAADFRGEASALLGSPGAPKYIRSLLAEPVQKSMEHWVSADADGAPLALARIQIDRDVAWIKYLMATDESRNSGVRYQLSAALFTSLAERKIRHVIVGSAFDLSPGLTYFQQRLGFVPMRVAVRDI